MSGKRAGRSRRGLTSRTGAAGAQDRELPVHKPTIRDVAKRATVSLKTV